jgi:pimeloyl-ACP methyl ester carboxylesterase
MRPPSLSPGRLAFGLSLLILAACANPVYTTRVDPKVVLRELDQSAISAGEPSLPTRNVLYERGLFEAFGEHPAAAIAALHRAMVTGQGDPDKLFALAELSFLHGQAAKKKEYFLAAAVYAYAFLFSDKMTGNATPARFDPRFRTAADLYNWALILSFRSAEGAAFVPQGGTFALPFGRLEVTFDPAALRVGDREMFDFVPIGELEVHGLAMRYRWPGLGAPLGAATRPIEGAKPGRDLIAPRIRVPVTALLRISEAQRALVQGEPLTSKLELHLAWDGESVSIAGERVPLELEPSAALALSFTAIPVLEIEMLGFLGRLTGIMAERPPLISATPYKPGLIPVVFVHGTESSVVRWAEMYNRLLADPDLRGRFQFWFFQYDSGNPILLSSLGLRDALVSALKRLDPEGKDPALRKMVLVGHSQGGLLVKMQVINSGSRFWDAVATKPLDDFVLSDKTRELFRRGMFVEPLPEVSRVVFICTPHRGSFVAARNIIRNLVRALLTLPTNLAGLDAEIIRNRAYLRSGVSLVVPSAVDNMSPRNPFILTIQDIPVVSSVKDHSIIAIETDGPVEEGNDGVVTYKSAHIEPVESEVIVRPSPHSTQGNPHTIEEVRRILRLHLGLKTDTAPIGTP